MAAPRLALAAVLAKWLIAARTSALAEESCYASEPVEKDTN
jgi:hypothetical protein